MNLNYLWIFFMTDLLLSQIYLLSISQVGVYRLFVGKKSYGSKVISSERRMTNFKGTSFRQKRRIHSMLSVECRICIHKFPDIRKQRNVQKLSPSIILVQSWYVLAETVSVINCSFTMLLVFTLMYLGIYSFTGFVILSYSKKIVRWYFKIIYCYLRRRYDSKICRLVVLDLEEPRTSGWSCYLDWYTDLVHPGFRFLELENKMIKSFIIIWFL